MQSKENDIEYKPEHDAATVPRRFTLMLPFFVLTFLVLPSLLVMDFGRTLTGFGSFLQVGFLGFVRTASWLIVPAAAVCGVVYLVRGQGIWGRVAAAVLLLILAASFAFAVLPSAQATY